MATLFTTDCSNLGDWDQVAANMFVGSGGFSGDGIGSTIAPYSLPWLCKRVSPTPSNEIRLRWMQYIPAGSIPFPPYVFYIVGGIYCTGGGPFTFDKRQVSINTNANGDIFFKLGTFSGPDIAFSSPTGWLAGMWNEVDIRITVSTTLGSIFMSRNGVTILDQSGLNTQALGTSEIDGIEIVPQSVAGPTTALIDNVIFSDDTPEVVPDDDGSGDSTIKVKCCAKQPATGDTGKAPDPVGEAPAFLLTCIGAGQPDTNMSLVNGETL